MKIVDLVKEHTITKKMDWLDDPNIGWFLETDPCRVYYGVNDKKIENILENGIFADSDGYIKCSIEPYTAHYHAMPLTETLENDSRVVFVIDLPQSFSTKNPFYTQFDKDKDLYESWGKSDVEFYALEEIYIPKHIPTKYIKGYMIKNDS